MQAFEFHSTLLTSLGSRSDITCEISPLRHHGGTYGFLRIASAEIAPSDKVILIAAGVHGDEAAGPLTLLQYGAALVDRIHAAGLKTIIYPLRNPSGFEAGLRYNIDSDNGDAGNNDLLRYMMADGTVVDDLGSGDTFASWGWASETRLGVRLPEETILFHSLLKKDPLTQVVACIDLHQDRITPGLAAGAYHYAFGDLSRYEPVVERIRRVVPIVADTSIGAGYRVAIDGSGAITSDDTGTAAAMRTDANGFISRHDGTLADLLWRHGAAHAVTTETTGACTTEEAIAVNMHWIEGLIALCAS